jgi:anti-repressor protein
MQPVQQSQGASDLQIFNNDEFGNVRVVQIEGEPWFVGKDVAGCLGYANSRKALIDHVDDDDKNTVTIRDGNKRGNPNQTVINESGLYSLIMSSKLPSAKRFKRWVTAEVLPQIRKTGGYIPVDQGDSDLMIMAKALNIMQNTLADKDSIIKALQPKADFADCMLKCNNSISVGEFAKVITDNGFEIGRNRLFKYLRDQHYLMKDNIPYQRYMKNDIFQLKEGYHFEGSEYIQDFTTLITPKGQEYLYGKIKDDIQQGRFVA